MRETNSRALLPSDAPTDSSVRIVLLFAFAPHPHAMGIAGYAAHGALAATALLFLLPRQNRRSKPHRIRPRSFLRFGFGIFRIRNANLFAANQILDSTRRMVDALIGGSKLCACATRHATGKLPSAFSVAQLGKGRAFGPPRCIPSHVPQAAADTVPVSAPFGSIRVVAFRAWEKRP
jgi:hypothetical protein